MTKIHFHFFTAMIVASSLTGMVPSPGLAEPHSVSDLIHKLQSEEPDQREQAVEALGALGPEAAGAVPALQKALSDDFPYVRTRAADALAKIGPAAIPAFIEALKNPNGDVRAISASALGQFGAQANAAIPGLVNALHDVEPPVRERSEHALEQIGPAVVRPLLQRIQITHDGSTVLALKVLGAVPSTDDALVPQMVRVLENTDDQIRMAASNALARQGSNHIPELVQALKSENPAVRARVADILADVGRHAGAAAPALIDLLNDPSPLVRGSAARALGHLGSEAAKSAVAPLKKLLQDPDASVAARAREALTNVTATTSGRSEGAPEEPKRLKTKENPPAAEKPTVKKKLKPAHASTPKTARQKAKKSLTAADLIPRLKSPDETVRTNAMNALIDLGPKAIPDLIPALQDGTTVVRQDIAVVFIQIDSTAAIQAFQDCAKGGDLPVRLDALRDLQAMGETAKSAAPMLIGLLKDPSREIQSAAENILEHLGTDEAKNALDAYRQLQLQKTIALLIKALRQNGKAADEAMLALVKLKGPAVMPVAQLLNDPHPAPRRAAAQVLNQLGTVSYPATNALIDALDNPDAEVRHLCAATLAKINSPDAKKALRFFPVKDKILGIESYFKH